MATPTVSLTANAREYSWVEDFFSNQGVRAPIASSATSFSYRNSADADIRITFTGTGLTYNSAGNLIGGVVTGFTVFDAGIRSGVTVLQGSNFSLAADILGRAIFGFDRGQGDYQQSGPWDILRFMFSSSNAVFNGTSRGDDMNFGEALGNQTFNGRGGDDLIAGNAGKDKYDGGTGIDVLSFEDTHFNPSQGRGVVLDVKKGTVTDSWGGKDTFKNFEEYRGSVFGDTMNGSRADEVIRGGAGADRINGDIGIDTVEYHRDFRLGGTQGIIANLSNVAAQTVVDGFGFRDRLTNIENVVGTNFSDSITGSAVDNRLYGLNGADTINGGAGNDEIVGGGGADRLTGGLGSDEFIFQKDYNDYDVQAYNMQSQFGDTITDFVSGVDRIEFNTRGDHFGSIDMDRTVRLTIDAGPTSDDSSFILRTAGSNSTLFWDRDGNGGEYSEVRVVNLTGVTVITEADIELF